jgi:hypothetical protein
MGFLLPKSDSMVRHLPGRILSSCLQAVTKVGGLVRLGAVSWELVHALTNTFGFC